MSYEKKVAAGAVPAKVVFYYTLDSLFNDASMRSMYRTRNNKDAAGVSMVDDLAITEDERNIHLSLVEDAVYDVFLRFLQFTKAITNAIAHNVNYTPTAGVEAKTSYVQIVDNANYNENYLSAVDKSLLKAIRFYTLRDWFTSQGQAKEAGEYDALYIMAMRNVDKYSFQLKKATV